MVRSTLGVVLMVGVLLVASACADGVGQTALSVTVTSHEDGVTVLGDRNVQIIGTVVGASAVTVSSAAANVPASVSDGTFEATLRLDDGANDLVVTASRGSESVTVTLELVYPFLDLSPFPVADVVIGGLRDDVDQSVSATSVAGPYSTAASDGGRLYLGDFEAQRVLVFDSFPEADGAAAAVVLGQPDFTSSGAGLGPASFNGVAGVAAADGHLFVPDRANHRVMVWTSPPTENGAAADFALGQDDLDSAASGCSVDRFLEPNDVAVAGGRLLVADNFNRRVLVWNTLPTSPSALPDLVLGQVDFDTCDAAGATAFGSILSVWADETRVLVADYANHRVLQWSTFPTSNGVPPDVVLGQSDFETTTASTTAAGLSNPHGVTSNGNQIFVTDTANHRVLVWDAFPTTSGVAADRVIGQSSFDLGAENDTNQDGSPGPGVSAATMAWPYFGTIVDGALVVSDYDNGRYLVFR
ncbi:MAG: hypothetical protein EA416_02365 [Trueperaceae bacterium]|nr:MAG: hypothetical protein EA416_02365 [Trueperaceae bacterium]